MSIVWTPLGLRPHYIKNKDYKRLIAKKTGDFIFMLSVTKSGENISEGKTKI